MKRWIVMTGVLALGTLNVLAGVRAGDPAPEISAPDATGKEQKLADYKGKYIVLEWTNPGCPFVKRQYESHTMQDAQKAAEAKGAVWFTVGTGHSKTDWAKRLADTGATPTAVLPDADASIAKAFGAKTTPHMFVIGPDGKVIYEGAPDDGGDNAKEAKNYVLTAIEEAQAGKPVSKPDTKPYGCGVHY
jgi:peroxiredoxin